MTLSNIFGIGAYLLILSVILLVLSTLTHSVWFMQIALRAILIVTWVWIFAAVLTIGYVIFS